MFYPKKLQKTASPGAMGQNIMNFIKRLSVPTSVNNAVRPEIMKGMKTTAKLGLGVGAGTYLGNKAFNQQQEQNQQWQYPQ